MIGWAILDGARPYIAICYATRKAAERERDALLKHFPPKHAWRKRLVVQFFNFEGHSYVKKERQ